MDGLYRPMLNHQYRGRISKKLGVCLIDLGGGTSVVAIFMDDSISHTINIPVGGDHVTNDIARAIQTPTNQAEELKKKYGCASS